MLIFKFRKLGKILRGKATPYQLMAACVLGSLLGFVPGFGQAPGLIAALLLLLIILNANLFLAGLVTLFAKGVSLLLTPVTFAAGRFLLEGPAEGFFRTLVNAPVLAFFGFEYYVVTGGVVLGLVFGVALGVAVILGLRAYWRRMAALEKNSARFSKWTGKGWVKAVSWVILGPDKKDSYADVLQHKTVGNPVRTLGVVFAVLAAVFLFLINLFFADEIVTQAVRGGLERANGATVELESGQLSLREGRLTLAGLAMADPNDLNTDLFKAAQIEADLSVRDLLSKRWTIDRLMISEGRQGEERRVPGRLTEPRPRPSPDPDLEEDEKRIQDYLRDAEKWKDRLAQARKWLDRLSGPEDDEIELPPDVDEEEIPERETRRQRIEREIREHGYDRVMASHLIEQSPRLLIKELLAERVRSKHFEDETLDIRGEYLSTNPSLVESPPRLSVRSSSEKLVFDLELAAAAGQGGGNRLELVYRDLPADVIGGQLAGSGEPPLSGGTIDFQTNGRLSAIDSDLPVQVTLKNTTLRIPNLDDIEIEELTLPVGFRGAIDNPRITFDDRELANALARAGRGEAERRIREEIEDRVGDDIEDRGRQLLDRFR